MESMKDLYSIVPVTNGAAALEWFATFFGRPADEIIGEEALWQVGENAWVVIDERDATHAGHFRLTIGVEGLDDILARLTANGIDHEPVETYGNGVRHVVVMDPDGNNLAFAESPTQ